MLDSVRESAPPTLFARAESESAHAEYLSRRVFGSLDGLRATCILAVIWHHTHAGFDWLPGSKLGFLGVQMFFVISGFLIVTLLLRERGRTRTISLRRFYARRTLRIFPLYYAILLALCVVYALHTTGRAALFWAELPYYLTYTSNWVPVAILPLTWSLATEEQFYLFWPPIEKFLSGAAVPLMVLFIVLNQFVNFGIGPGAPGAWIAEQRGALAILQATFTPICLGVLLAHALHDREVYRVFHGVLAAPLAAVVVTLLLFLMCNLPHDETDGAHRLAIQVLMAGVVGACVIVESNGLRAFLQQSVMIRIGVVSYGMYLFHPFVTEIVRGIGLGDAQLARFALSTALTYLVAELSFRFLETPFLRWKSHFAS